MQVKYQIAIPTKGRADNLLTLNLFPNWENISLFVDSEKEKKEYRKYNKNVDIVVTNQNRINRVRNYILDYYDKNTNLLMLDDDVIGIYKLAWKRVIKIKFEELDLLIKNGFNLCRKNNTKLFGIYPIKNYFFMNNTISVNQFIIGTFTGVIIGNIRHDDKIVSKEDYDFTLQHIIKYKKAIRYNYYCVEAKHYTNKGGAILYRNKIEEREMIEKLKRKYPNCIIDNVKRPNEILLKVSLKKKKNKK